MSTHQHELLPQLRMMLLIRRFEERLDDLFASGVIKGTSHLYAGQEAVAVGVCAALRRDDYITYTHRGHGPVMARGGDAKAPAAGTRWRCACPPSCAATITSRPRIAGTGISWLKEATPKRSWPSCSAKR